MNGKVGVSRGPGGFIASFALVFLAMTLFVGLGAKAAAAGGVAPRPAVRNLVVIYYANETTVQATRSANYAALLAILRKSSNPAAGTIAAALAEDAKEFPASVADDVDALMAAARRNGFGLAVFTNALTFDHRYLLYRPSAGTVEIHWAPVLPEAANPPLATSPLSRPDYFLAALSAVGAAYPADTVDAVLITRSHGTDAVVFTPRVFADLAVVRADDLLAEISAPATGERRASAAAIGTTKLEYWQVLAEASAMYGMRFPLVFRAACQSGIAGLRELLAVPGSVGTIAHSGRGSIKYRDIDYAAVFATQGRAADLPDLIASALRTRGIHVDHLRTLWIEQIGSAFRAGYPILFFMPLAIWLAWLTLGLFALLPPARARRPVAAVSSGT